jgi:hypothetical protein
MCLVGRAPIYKAGLSILTSIDMGIRDGKIKGAVGNLPDSVFLIDPNSLNKFSM